MPLIAILTDTISILQESKRLSEALACCEELDTILADHCDNLHLSQNNQTTMQQILDEIENAETSGMRK
jgi:hypothetical protein